MASTFSIGGVSFGALNSGTTGRMALSISAEAPEYQKQRFHVPGTDGNAIIREGRTGRIIVARMRYCEALATALTHFNDDGTAWANTAVEIVDDNGVHFDRCNLVHMRRVTDPRSLGKGNGVCFFDAVATFTQD